MELATLPQAGAPLESTSARIGVYCLVLSAGDVNRDESDRESLFPKLARG
jgi:hypothetical protein